jgi:chemotaxis protein MotB
MAARPKVAPAPAPAVAEDDDHDCPACPPPGAPAWLATFADIATNLMAFFVLILGFAQFDEPSFKKMAGSMRETFGSRVVGPVMEFPEGSTMIEMNFRPTSLPNSEQQSAGPSDAGDGEKPASDGKNDGRPADAVAAAANALMDALQTGGMTVEQGEASVTVHLSGDTSPPDAAALAQALAQVAGTEPTVAPPAPTGPQNLGAAGDTGGATGQGASEGDGGHSPGFAEAKLSIALKDQIGKGLVSVERRDGSVYVTVGAGGAFQSGSADLTDQARQIINDIATSSLGPDARITVTGHTDSTPLGASPYVDNLGLGAARASAVVRSLVETGIVGADQATAVSKGESAPVADNATPEGREKNRRIEIEIAYGGA